VFRIGTEHLDDVGIGAGEVEQCQGQKEQDAEEETGEVQDDLRNGHQFLGVLEASRAEEEGEDEQCRDDRIVDVEFEEWPGDGGDEGEPVAMHGIAVQVEGRDETTQRETGDGVGEEADLPEVFRVEEEVGHTILHPQAFGDVAEEHQPGEEQ